MGDGVRHPDTYCDASIRTKVSGGFGDRALVTPSQQKFKLLIILLDSRGSSITSSKFVTYTICYIPLINICLEILR